ncbi:MAG TPA: hypothetical protein VFB16_06735 [Bauldia sp.]|nr:hypothetical protein [Bauldia sp.]
MRQIPIAAPKAMAEREAQYRQFDVLRRTAELLIEKTRAEAS